MTNRRWVMLQEYIIQYILNEESCERKESTRVADHRSFSFACTELPLFPFASASMAVAMAVPSSSASMPISSTSPSSASPSSSSPSVPKLGISRRLLLPALVVSAPLISRDPAFGKDIPLFGIRKRVEQAEKKVVEEVKEIVKEGELLVQEGELLVQEKEKEISSSVSAIDSPPPLYQAAAVAGAELVAVLVASSVVGGLVSET